MFGNHFTGECHWHHFSFPTEFWRISFHPEQNNNLYILQGTLQEEESSATTSLENVIDITSLSQWNSVGLVFTLN